MKFNTIAITALSIIASGATQVNARRRHLNTIKGDESDASMSYMLSPARGSSKSKSATGAPTGSPTSAPTAFPTGSPTPEPKPGECGSIIDTGEVFTLQEDILDCDCRAFGYALKVDGRGTVLNLNGHTVECKSDRGTVIEIVGDANTVMGPGMLKGGDEGILLKDGGFHTIKGVTIGPVDDDGILIQSNDNTIINNFITEPSANGVLIRGFDRNIIKGNTIVNAGLSGIRLDTVFPVDKSEDNEIHDNTIISATRFGLKVTGNRSIIQGNTINQSGSRGIVLSRTEGVIIKDNSITNSVVGVQISAGTTNTVVTGNTFAGNNIVNLSVSAEAEDPITAGNTPNLM